MAPMLRCWVAGLALVAFSGSASAETISYSDSARFTSDTNPDQIITLPSFDETGIGGPYLLNSVTVELFHSGAVDVRGDNDDPANAAAVQALMSRSFLATGPDLFTSGSHTLASEVVSLAADDGDGGDNNVFDATPFDGTDFGGSLAYEDLLASLSNPSTAFYATSGAGTVDFTIDATLMDNNQQFIGAPPDAWQLEVLNPTLEVEVHVTYDYSPVPEPTTLSFLALSGLVLTRSRRR